MEKEEIIQTGIQLMSMAEAAYLTTIGPDGFPYTRVMFNLRNESQFPNLTSLHDHHRDDLQTYLTTNTSSVKMRHIAVNPKVALFFADPGRFHGLLLGGMIETVGDRKLKEKIWQAGWEIYYPQGVDDPDYTVLKLKPSFARGWYKDQPFEWIMNP